jgi:K+-sensing histidine kinase KdpD
VVPVAVGVVVGGYIPGALASVVGFVFYDTLFLPPYGNLKVKEDANWLALIVYLVVAQRVAQVVSKLNAARDEARRRAQDAARLYELSQALIGEFTISELLDHIANTVETVFAPRWTRLCSYRQRRVPRSRSSSWRRKMAKHSRPRNGRRSPRAEDKPGHWAWRVEKPPAGSSWRS